MQPEVPDMFGGVSVGPCPWGSSLGGAVLAALAAQEGREQGPGEGGGKKEGAPGPSAGRGKEWLAERWALGGESGREQWTRVWHLEEKWLGERELAFIDALLCAESFARPCR